MSFLDSDAATERNARKAGVLLIVLSAVVFSTAGVFTKSVAAGAWEIIFWRGIFAAAFTTAFVMWRGTLRQEFVEMGGSGWAVAIIGATGSAAFIPAFKYTTMANVMLIYAVAPILAALLAWIWIRERMSWVVMLGCIGAFVGVAIIVSGSKGQLSLKGDLLALWMTVAMATLMAIYRRFPDTPAAGPAAVSSLVLLPVALYYVNPLAIPLTEFFVIALFGLIFAVASVTLAEGMKRVPAGEAALLSTLETPLAPVFGWLFFAEVLPTTTFVGGSLVLFVVVSSQLFATAPPPLWLRKRSFSS